ncbi:cytochrome b5-related protein-like [Leptidea sinapis]|uniref:cytochrome b5-related protein-like n=1 Tax=Leptidea sinapis TaxID=189913 RepID=UPI00212BBB2A|nr:cytochrome b5-related protein-like [Leptidea sinapis]
MAPKESDYLEIAQQRAIEKKTHVSFPQLKYPSLRDEGLRDSMQWLTGKAIDDGAEGLWRVHDKLYDLDTFINKHPGGSEWLQLTKGTDITEAFEVHHLNPSTVKVLEKFYKRDAKTPRNSPFTFKDDGFYRTLKNKVWEEIQKIPNKESIRTSFICDSLLFTCLVSSTITCWAKDYWIVMLSYIVASVSMAWVMVAAHNYIHKRTNWRMYLFNIGLWSYRDFRVSHALSHHLFANTLMDLEVSGFEPIVFWNPRKEQPFYAKYSVVLEQILFPFMFIMNFLKRFSRNFTHPGFFTQHYRWHDGLGFLLPVWMYITGGATFYDTLTMWLWINCSASFVFFTIASNAAHHHPNIFKDGDEVSDVNPDWGMHEVEAVMDRRDINGSHFRVMTFFGHHALHHLFPILDHAVLEHLYPLFLENCEKYRANFRTTSQFDMIIGQIQMTLKTRPTLLSERK